MLYLRGYEYVVLILTKYILKESKICKAFHYSTILKKTNITPKSPISTKEATSFEFIWSQFAKTDTCSYYDYYYYLQRNYAREANTSYT